MILSYLLLLLFFLFNLLQCLYSFNNSKSYYNAYKGHTVYKTFPKDRNQFDKVERLSHVFGNKIDFWSELRYPIQWIDVMVSPAVKHKFETTLNASSIEYNIMIPDVSESVHQQMQAHETATRMRRDDEFDYNEYHELWEIEQWIDKIASDYPDYVTVLTLARSFEGRRMRVIKISTTDKSLNYSKPAIWIDGCIHAREWISTATVIFITKMLLSQYETDDAVHMILDKFDFFILPVLNVDGYDYTWKTKRLWRKSRSINSKNPKCIGVDLNRNWDYNWEVASKEPCHETYAGSHPFSEPEVKAVAEFLVKNNQNIISYISFHSYSQLWLSPWSSRYDLPAHHIIQNMGSKFAVEALHTLYQTPYYHGSPFILLYPAHGVSMDYVYGKAKIVFSYVVELRDTGKHGFLLPSDQIQETALETFEGLKGLSFYMMNFIKNASVENDKSYKNYISANNFSSQNTDSYVYIKKHFLYSMNVNRKIKSETFLILICIIFSKALLLI